MGLERTTVYLDSCLAIYLVEEKQPFVAIVQKLYARSDDANFVISDLTKMECLVVPFRKCDSSLIAKFQGWFDQVKIVPIVRSVFIDAAHLRAAHPGVKTPDAIHLTAAKRFGCDEFWTNDNRLAKAAPLKTRNISDE